jgi:hypothetical protein
MIKTNVRRSKHEPHTECPNSPRLNEINEGHNQEQVIIFFDIKGIVHKEFILASQTVNFTYYCDVLRRLRENMRDFAPNFGDKKTGPSITTTHCLTLPSSPENFFLPNTT